MAEFDLSRLWDDYGYDEELNCWWARDPRGRMHRFEGSKRSQRRTLRRPDRHCTRLGRMSGRGSVGMVRRCI
jgi:hypothetical protein